MLLLVNFRVICLELGETVSRTLNKNMVGDQN